AYRSRYAEDGSGQWLRPLRRAPGEPLHVCHRRVRGQGLGLPCQRSLDGRRGVEGLPMTEPSASELDAAVERFSKMTDEELAAWTEEQEEAAARQRGAMPERLGES